jgi:hypothetical protein
MHKPHRKIRADVRQTTYTKILQIATIFLLFEHAADPHFITSL